MPHPPRAAATDDPFRPIEGFIRFVYIVTWCFVALTLFLVVKRLLGLHSSVSVFALDDRYACVDVNDSFGMQRAGLVHSGASVAAATSSVCVERPSLVQNLSASVGGMLFTALLLVACRLVLRTIRTARLDGLFTWRTAVRIWHLGWLMVAMGVVLPVVDKLGKGLFVASEATPVLHMWSHWWAFLANDPQPDWLALVFGLGVLSFARIMQRAVGLQEEAALTV